MSKQVETLKAVCKAKQEALNKELADQGAMISGWETSPVPVEWLRCVSETFMRLAIRRAEIDMMRGMISEMEKTE